VVRRRVPRCLAYLTVDRHYSAVMRKPDLQAGSLPDLARGLAEL
jgi:hypothetical protein